MASNAVPMRSEVAVARANSYKRVADLVVLILIAPIALPLLLLTGVLVGVTLGRPVLFSQERAGYKGRPFKILKFRSMTSSMDESGKLLPDAQRITRVGKAIRLLSLDEVPQLLNIIKGEMSFVGPRPLYLRYLDFYTDVEKRRHDTRPGVTGMAQSMGRNNLGWDARLALDVAYVDSVGLSTDARIVMRTLRQVVRQSGVAAIAGETGEPLDVIRSYPVMGGYSIRKFHRGDIAPRVKWMLDPRTQEHMRLPKHVDEVSTLEWYRSVRDSTNRHDFVVYELESNVPCAMLGLKQESANVLPELYIFVDPNLSGRGRGRRSMELLLTWMKESSGLTGCTLVVGAGNHRAIDLYKKLDFRVEPHHEPGRLRMSLTLERCGAIARNR